MEKREKKMKCPGTVRNLYPIIPLSCLRSDIGECVVKVCGEHLKINKRQGEGTDKPVDTKMPSAIPEASAKNFKTRNKNGGIFKNKTKIQKQKKNGNG